MKLKLLTLGLMLGAAVATAPPEGPVLAQTGPTPTPTRAAGVSGTGTPTTAITPVSQTAPAAGSDAVAQPAPTRPPAPPPPTPRPGTTTTTPRAGGFPVGLAIPLLAGGAVALGGGIYLLRRGRRP